MKLFGSTEILVAQGNNAESLNFCGSHTGTCYIESMIQNGFNFDVELTFDSKDTTAFHPRFCYSQGIRNSFSLLLR